VSRVLKFMAVGYVVVGLIALSLERTGVYACRCEPECWCRRPGLSVFRWVFPRFPRLPSHEDTTGA
jgi:hypothetical protein